MAEERSFGGDLVARMTISKQREPYAEVKQLLSLNLFDHIHWQLNAIRI